MENQSLLASIPIIVLVEGEGTGISIHPVPLIRWNLPPIE